MQEDEKLIICYLFNTILKKKFIKPFCKNCTLCKEREEQRKLVERLLFK